MQGKVPGIWNKCLKMREEGCFTTVVTTVQSISILMHNFRQKAALKNSESFRFNAQFQ